MPSEVPAPEDPRAASAIAAANRADEVPPPTDRASASDGGDGAGASEPVLIPPRGLVAVTLVMALLVAAAAVTWPPAQARRVDPNLSLNDWRAEAQVYATAAARLDASLAEFEQAARSRADIAKAARSVGNQISAWQQRERDIGVLAARGDAQTRLMHGRLEETVRAFVSAFGGDLYRGLAVRYGRDVRIRFEAVLAAASVAGDDLRTWILREPRSDDVTALEAHAAGIAAALAQAGLGEYFDGQRLEPAAALVVEALAMQRVFSLAIRVPGVRPELDEDLVRTLLAFRVEAHQGLDLGRRLALVEELRRLDPTWPATWDQAVLLARAGRFRAAAGLFDAAARMGEHRDLARANARWCRDRLHADQTPP